MLSKLPSFWIFIILIALTIVSISLAVLFGAFPLISEGKILTLSEEKLRIILNLRVPRVLCCALVGALLSCCGLISQTLLRNPLACPYTLGISQLVSLILFSFIYLHISYAIMILCLIVISLLLMRRKIRSAGATHSSLIQTLILLGLAIGSFCSSIILALQFMLDGLSLMQMTRWLMGSLSVVGYEPLVVLFIAFLLMFICSYRRASDLDWLCFGEEFALSRGVSVESITLGFAALLCLSVAVVVWMVGPIGFVGLIIPHISRLLGFVKHRDLIIVSSLSGAIFLCLSDLMSRIVFSPIEIPVGVVTGLIGAPAFVFLLINSVTKSRERF